MNSGRNNRVVVAGAGVGGLAAAALLARKGFDVTVIERQRYPGGCAATFSRGGYRFDAGATVGCGFQNAGPLDLLGCDLGLSWPALRSPVAWEYVSGDISLPLSSSKRTLLERFPRSLPFWEDQERLASILWKLSGDILPWPPAGAVDAGRLLGKAVSSPSSVVHLLRFLNGTALQWLASYGLDRESAFVRFIDAQLLISVQTTAAYASAVNAAIALDLPSKGTCRLTGGIGSVAEELAASVERSGGRVVYGLEATALEVAAKKVRAVVCGNGESVPADVVIANLTPESLERLPGAMVSPRSVIPGAGRPCAEWSAFVLYLGVREEVFSRCADHLQIVRSEGALGEGRSIFVSVSPSDDARRAPEGFRAVTVSTHTRPAPWFDALNRGKDEYKALKRKYTRTVLALLGERFGGLEENIGLVAAGTPVTWERYTGRWRGYVGGYPQTSLFRVRGPLTAHSNLFMVGDSVFPGQSLPGVVTGARRVVDLVERVCGQ